MELELRDLRRTYGKKEALCGISLRLTPGICGLLGPNGAGKSTLMNILSGNLAPSAGSVFLDGTDTRELGAAFRARLGYVPQQQTFYPGFTAERFLYYIAALRGMSRQRARERMEQVLEALGLTEVRAQPIRSLSGGMKQRLLLAQAILDEPDILILDEPTAGLDPRQRIAVRNLIAEIGMKKIVLISTHVVSDIEFIAGRVALLRKGTLIADGTPADLIRGVEGRVWEAEMEEEQAREASRWGMVAGLSRSSTGVLVRLLAEAPPPLPCSPARPTLEDVYLWHFGDEVVL